MCIWIGGVCDMKSLRIIICMSIVTMFFAISALAAPITVKPITRPPKLATQRLAIDPLQAVFAEKQIATDKQAAIRNQFNALPQDLQHNLLQLIREKPDKGFYTPVKLLPKYTLRPDLVRTKPPGWQLVGLHISSLYPDEGIPDSWGYVLGNFLDADCNVSLDGTPRATYYLDMTNEFFPRSLAFYIPATASKAQNHKVQVVNKKTKVLSNEADYMIIAPRGYRGYHGWNFGNFGDPVVPWNLYRDWFGQSSVEYSNGTHRPAAQIWYDEAYKGVGGGGNCFGMSMSSLRSRGGTINTFHQGWFNSHPQAYTWQYPWQTETKETVQQDQGGQISVETWAHINYLWNHQTHKQAWERANTLVNEPNNRPLILFWAPKWGHATVGYDTDIVGTSRRIYLYDNNGPYKTNESGGPDKSICQVNWNNSEFSYGSSSADKMICLSFQEGLEDPHLPAEATGGAATGTVIAIISGSKVTQVTDDRGKQFFNANGQENKNAATRIPDSMKFIPLTGNVQNFNYPDMFIFNNAQGRTLNFSMAQGNKAKFQLFQAGDLFQVEFAGAGQIGVQNLLTNTRALNLPAPDQLRPTKMQMIKVADVDRVFDINNIRNLTREHILLQPAPDGSALDIQAPPQLQFDMRLETFANRNNVVGQFMGLTLDANSQAKIAPAQWATINTGQLNVQLRERGSNRVLRNTTIQQKGRMN